MAQVYKIPKEDFLLFTLNNQVYAIPIMTVVETIVNQQITYIPKAETYIVGITNFRGEALTVIDLTKKLKFEEKAREFPVIIVVTLMFDNREMFAGILAEEILSLCRVPVTEVKAVPEIGVKIKKDYLLGSLITNYGLSLVLNMWNIVFEDFARSQSDLSSKSLQLSN